MNYIKSNFKEDFVPWILNTFPPTSLIFSSPNAQKILGKNFLSPSQFMRPFGDLTGTSLVFTFNDKYQNVVSNFKFDFYDSQDFRKIENNQINNYIINCLSTETIMPNFENNFIKLNKNDIKNFITQLKSITPLYYLEFEKLYFEICKFQETELYQQPLLNIYLCDINDNITIVSDLLLDSLPKLISSGAYEKNTIDLIILLNDKSDKMSQNLNKIVLETNFKNKYYGKDIITIDINSGYLNQNKNDLCNDIWSKYIHKIEEYSDGFDPIQRGKYITNNEINIFKQKFADYIKNKFRAKLLDLISKLDKNLAKTTGINSILNKLKPTKIERPELIVEYGIPKLYTAERQRYLLSILLFHIRDYLDAYENLKKLKDNIKGRNKDYENAVKQFLIICRYMKKEDKIKIDTLAPFQSYIDNKQYLLAYRNMLLFIKMTELLETRNIISNVYKYNNYLSNHIIKYFNGLLYEKIGFFNLISKQPKPRKFALNVLNYSTQQYLLEKENDIKNYYLVQNFGYILDLFKIDYDYSILDNYNSINSYSFIKKYIYKSLCSACDLTNNIQLGIPVFLNYLRYLLIELSNISNNTQKGNIYDNENEEINFYFQKLNSLFIKGKIHYLENFPLPIINDDSLVFYIEQDQKILKENNKYNLNLVTSFKKYTELSIEQKYSVLSKEDISCLRFLDEQLSRNFKSNYFMKRTNNVKVGENIFISLNIKNPLNINLSIKNMTLIINETSSEINNNNLNNKNDYECGLYNIDIQPGQTTPVGMKIIFKNPGIYEIVGLVMTLFKNIHIKYIFNKPKINSLYLHYNKNKNNKDSSFNKGNFRFNTIEGIKTISVIINNNNEKIHLYQNQINYIPIKIINNNNDFEIKKFTIYMEANDDKILYPKYLHKNYLNSNNSVLIPIIGNKKGECKLKIIIKYEEKLNSRNLDIYRSVISIKVIEGINLNIEDKIYEYNKTTHKRQIKLNLDIIDQINCHSISFSKSKSLLYNKEKFLKEEINNQNQLDEIQDKNICQNIILTLIEKEKREKFINDQLFEDILGNKKKEDENNYEHIIEFLKTAFNGDNNLIVKYKLNFLENNNIHSINCIYKHEIKINDIPNDKMFYIDKLYLKNFLIKCFNINFEAEDIDDEKKYLNIKIKLLNNNEFFDRVKQMIDYIEIKVNLNDNNFEWIGLSSTILQKLNSIKEDEEIIKTFNCLIDKKCFSLNDKKRDLNLNHFIFSVKLINSNSVYQFFDFPYNIYYSFN